MEDQDKRPEPAIGGREERSHDEQRSGGGREITITRAEARRLVNYAHMASSANWTPFIRENGVGGEDSPWVEFLRVADRLWTVLFPDHDIRSIDPRLPADRRAPDVPTLLEALTDLERLLREVAPEYAESTVAANARAALARVAGAAS